MAWSSAAVTAADLAFQAADKPFIASYTQDSSSGTRWASGLLGTPSSSDVSDTGFDANFGLDGLPGITTKPTPAGTQFTYVMQFSALAEFDFLAILNHNLYSVGVSAAVLQIADDSAFTTNLQTLVTFDPSAGASDQRVIELDLHHTGSTPLRYSGVAYARLTLTLPSGVPRFGQIILGRRWQLEHQPDNPWDPTNLSSSVGELEARDGSIYSSIRHRGRRNLAGRMPLNKATLAASIKAWFRKTKHGGRSFVWCDLPNSEDDEFALMRIVQPSLTLPYIMWSTREFNLVAKEQGPTFLELELEDL